MKRCDGTTVFNYTFNCFDGQVNLCKCPPPHPLITFYVLIPGYAIHRLIRESESSLASKSFLSRKTNVNFLHRHVTRNNLICRVLSLSQELVLVQELEAQPQHLLNQSFVCCISKHGYLSYDTKI